MILRLSTREARAGLRAAYRCDCEDERHPPGPGDCDPRVVAVHATIERVTGDRPAGCPWRAFESPAVGEVLGLLRAASSGMGYSPAAVMPLDPPHVVFEGLLYYLGARDRVQSAIDKARDEKRENERRARPQRGR